MKVTKKDIKLIKRNIKNTRKEIIESKILKGMDEYYDNVGQILFENPGLKENELFEILEFYSRHFDSYTFCMSYDDNPLITRNCFLKLLKEYKENKATL